MSLGYSISSHVTYAPLTLPVLLPSLKAAGVPADRVFVWVCGAKRRAEVKTGLGRLCFVEHESRTFAAFIEPLQRRGREFEREFDWWFVLNDTMRVGSLFGELSNRIDQTKDAIAAAWLPGQTDHAQTELGAYRSSFLHANRDWIMGFLNAGVVLNAHHEGELYSRCIPEKRGVFGDGAYELKTPEFTYGTETLRRPEYYPALDMWKFKSNWGQHGWDKFYEGP